MEFEQAIYRRWAVSCHESAHAVVAEAMGLPVGQMSITGSGGHTAFRVTMADLRAKRDLIVTAAGVHGEDLAAHHSPPPLPPMIEVAAETGETSLPDGPVLSTEIPLTDEQFICAFLNAVYPDDTTAWLKRYDEIHNEARAIVHANEQRIIDLARRLFLCGHLESIAA